MKSLIINVLLIFIWSGDILAADNISFKELYHAAIKNNATILNQEVSIEIASEEKNKTYSSVRPQLNLVSSTVWREQANVGAFGEGRQHNAYASLSQPLFSGGAEYYALKIAKTFPEIAKLNKNVAEIQLYTQLSELFYEGIRLQNEKKILIDQNKLLQERISTLQKRASIGRSKSTEVLAARSSQAKVIAETSLNQKQMDFLNQKIRNLTRLESDYNFVEEKDPLSLTIITDWEKKY
jgi:outer membrane protein TolC